MLGGKGADCCMGSGMSIGSLPSPNARLVQRTRGLGGSALAPHRCVLRRCRDVARRHAQRVRCTRRVARRRERWENCVWPHILLARLCGRLCRSPVARPRTAPRRAACLHRYWLAARSRWHRMLSASRRRRRRCRGQPIVLRPDRVPPGGAGDQTALPRLRTHVDPGHGAQAA